MDYTETSIACEEAYKASKVAELREARDKALAAYEEANIAYLTARDAYHKIYRTLWKELKAEGK